MQQIGLDAVLNNVPDFTAGINKMNAGVDSFAQNSTKHGESFAGGFGEIVTGALRQIGTLAVDALMKAGQAVTGFVKDSIGLAGDFQSGMQQFSVAAGKDLDTSGLKQFHDLFLQLGKDLPVSTAEVQQAAIEMVKGGIDPAILAAGGLKQNIQFAAAAMGGDLVKAAEISSKIVGGWAEVGATAAQKADLLTHATDQMTKAANASQVDVEGLSRGIFNAQGIAKTAGVSFDDLTTTLAELAPRFSSSSEAGNSLKNMIVRLQPTTDPAIDAMTALGLYTEKTGSAFYDAQGNFVGFQQASQLLQESLKGLTKEQQAAALQTIFGNDAMSSASALAELGSAGYQEMADSMTDAMGVAEAGAILQDSFNTKLENAAGSLETLKLTIGEQLLPILSSLFDNYITPGINTLTEFASAVFGNDEAFSKLSPTMQAIAHGIDVLVADIQEIVGAFDDAGAGSSEFGESIGLLAKDLGLPGELIERIIFGVQDLVAWFNKAGNQSNVLDQVIVDLSDTWDNLLYTIEDVANGYQAIIQAVLPIVTQFVENHGEAISAFFQDTWNSIIQIVNLALAVYDSIVPPVLNAIAGFISAHGDEIQKIFGGVWEMITSIVTGALETIKGAIKLVLDVIHGDWNAAWQDIKNIIDAQATAIGGVVTGFLDAVAGIFDTSLADILRTWEDAWNEAVSIADKVGDQMIAAGGHIVGGIVQGIEDNASAIYAALKEIADKAVHAFLHAIGAESPAKEFMPAGQYAVQGIMQGMSDTWPQLTDLVSTMSDDLIGQVADIGERINSAIADGFGATASIDRQIAKNMDKFKDILPQYQQYTTGALKDAQQQAEGFLDPAEGAKYFKLRSDQILEYAKLQKDLDEAETQADKDRIAAQMLLINRAQTAEISAFQSNQTAAGNPYQDIIDQISQLFNNKALDDLQKQLGAAKTDAERARIQQLIEQAAVPVNDTGLGHDLLMLMQQLVGGTVAQPNMRAAAGAGAATSYSQSTTLNMPIYTNQSPSVLQSSMAIAGAALL